MSDRPKPPPHLWYLAILPFAWLVGRFEHLIDDAFISFRYAQNWAGGLGLRYNPGEVDPVEGFSNFAWVGLLTLGEKLGIRPELASIVLSVLCGVVTLALVYRFACRSLELSTLGAAGAVFFLALFPPFAVWTTGGLETAAFGLVLFAGWAELVRPGGARVGRASILALLLITLRPEGVVWSFGLLFAGWLGSEERRVRRGELVRYLGPLVGGLLVLFAARWFYFHDWLPNTARAKGGASAAVLLRGAKTVASYLVIFLSPALILAALPLALRVEKRRLVLSAALMYLAGLAWTVAVGGDWMHFFRFLAPLTPFLALLFGAAIDRLDALRRPAALGVGVALLALSLFPAYDVHLAPLSLRRSLYFRSFQAQYDTELGRFRRSRENLEVFSRTGRALATIAGPEDSLVMGAIGAIGYYSGVHIHDRNGLVDREVARREVTGVRSAGHDKRVPRAFFADRHPTWYEAVFSTERREPGQWASKFEGLIQFAIRQSEEDRALYELSRPRAVPIASEGEDLPAGTLLLLQGRR